MTPELTVVLLLSLESRTRAPDLFLIRHGTIAVGSA